MKQLSGLDAGFIHAEVEGLPLHIGGVTIYDPSTAPGGTVDFVDILAMLRQRIHLSPIFTRKLARVPLNLGQPYWVPDPDFELEYHVRHMALPRPGSWQQLRELAGQLHSQPLAKDRPLWEMYIIEGLNDVAGLPPGCFAVLLKIHHAAIDGASGHVFNNLMHDLSPQVKTYPAAAPAEPESPSTLRMLRNAYLDAWRAPLRAAKLVGSAIPAIGKVRKGYRDHIFTERDSPPRTRFQGHISPYRIVDARRFDFTTVRSIKQQEPGATINDVMLAVIGGGMRRYLDSKGELPDQSLTAGCPINVRSEQEQSAEGNLISGMTVELCTDIADPKQRLRAICERTRESKAFAEAVGSRLGLQFAEVVPGVVVTALAQFLAATRLAERSVLCNTVVTNVPGPTMQLYMCGAQLVDGFSLGPLFFNVGVFHVVYSSVQQNQGALTVSVTACRRMLPDIEHYMDCMQASFDELNRAYDQASKAVAKRRSSRKRAPRRKATRAAR